MVTRNVVLTEPQDQLVQALVASGRYQNVSEAMRAGLRLLEAAKMRSVGPLRLRARVHEPILPADSSCGS